MASKNGEDGKKRESGILYLFGSIEDAQASSLCEKIIELNIGGETPQIQMIINSPGGSIDAGFAIIDIMEWSQIPIYTTGIGSIASMGLLIFMAGEPGRRVLTPRTSILSHRYSSWVIGKHSDLIATRKEQDLIHCRIINHYIQHTKVASEEELNRTLLRDMDTWLTPQEAVDCGIADCIQGDRKRKYPGVMTRELVHTLKLQEVREA